MNTGWNCHSERSEDLCAIARSLRDESAFRKCAEKKQIPRATTALGMTRFRLFRKAVEPPLVSFHSLLLFLRELGAMHSAPSALHLFLSRWHSIPPKPPAEYNLHYRTSPMRCWVYRIASVALVMPVVWASQLSLARPAHDKTVW